MTKMRRDLPVVIVIGAGPAGLAFACRFAEHGGRPQVFEASPTVGGMARSIELWDSSVDLGPHRFFSSDPVVNAYWHQHVNGRFVMVQRQTRIFYQGKFFAYPLKPLNALRNLGLARAIVALASYASARFRPVHQDGSLERWVASHFGWKLYRTFFKTYTEKVWGVPCSDIDADWASQRIQGLTLWGAIRNALLGGRGNKLKTLADEFAYPESGNGWFYDRQGTFLETNSGTVSLNSRVRRVLVEGQKVKGIELSNGETLPADVVVSSMPITLLVKGLDGVPSNVAAAAEKLRFRNTILVYVRVGRREIFSDQWLYIHDPALEHGRITNFNNWSSEIIGSPEHTILCLEFWCFDNDSIWHRGDAELIAQARNELEQTGLVAPDEIEDGHVVRVPRSYPVYDRGYQDNLNLVRDHLDSIEGLFAIGRYGSFKYNNQDHSLLMGLLAADSLAKGERPDLWNVNTGSSYQESTDSGILRSSGLLDNGSGNLGDTVG